jgi:flagellar biosynthetic protein FlhB
MAEDAGDKTEAPTPRRRQEALDQGNIARSPDLAAACATVGGMVLLKHYGDHVVAALHGVMSDALSVHNFRDPEPARLLAPAVTAAASVAVAAAPLIVGLVLIGVVVNGLQVGLRLNTKRLTPNAAALNPLKGLRNLIGGGRGFVPVLINLAKFVAIAFVAYTALRDRMPLIVSAQRLEFLGIFRLAADVVYAVAVRVGVLLLVLALLDYFYKRWKIEQDLKMTKQQVKDEMRSMDGDPQVKSRRRQLAVDMVKQSMRKTVPTADVIVTNPTHYAVAIKYDAATMNAPRVVAKGKGPLAKHIREIAVANGIPILERKPLARALYKLVDVGGEVPEQFYSAVAEILAYVYELSGKLRMKQAG